MLNWRKKIFWIKDSLLGGGVKSHYLDIKKNIDLSVNTDNLDKLLTHAVHNCSFYSSIAQSRHIEDFPVVNKNIIKDNFEQIIARGYDIKKLHAMSTSGSTGTPFKSYQNKEKRNRVIAELIFLNEKALLDLGEKFIYFRVWNENNRKTWLVRFIQNIVCVNILRLNKTVFDNTLNILKNKKVSSSLAYASTYEHLLSYVLKNNIEVDLPKLKSVITSSEVMPISIKQALKTTFDCNVYDRYSNQENGIIAQSEDCSDVFLINHPSYLVEILKEDSNDLAEDGEIGRIVITDLFNYSMPFIRYDTGDLAIKIGEERFSKYVRSVQGRQVDVIYDTSGEVLTPHTLSVYMWKFNKINQYQFIQESKNEYILKVSDSGNSYSDKDFIEHLKPIFGHDANIYVEFVNSIPVLSSGKFKKTICNYTP